MRVFIVKKNIMNLKSSTLKKEYFTEASTVKEFLIEMIKKNYSNNKNEDALSELYNEFKNECGTITYSENKSKEYNLDELIEVAINSFNDGMIVFKNITKDIVYKSIDQELNFNRDDEIVLVRMKMVRGIVW